MIHTIALPWVKPPVTANEARSKRHYFTLNSEKHAVHLAVRVAVGTGRRSPRLPPMHEPVEVTLWWRLPDRRVRDSDSASWLLKACLDALVSCSVLEDDSWQYVRATTIRAIPPEPTVKGAMWLTLEEVRA